MASSSSRQGPPPRRSRPSTAEAHQLSQAQLAALMSPLLANAWSLVDLGDLSGTLPRFVRAVQAVVRRYGAAAAVVAQRYYDASRAASGVAGEPPRVQVPPVDADAVNQLVVDVVSQALADPSRPPLDALDAEAEQLVLEHGRQQIIQLSDADPKAKGWARVVEPGACSFCLMLAMRGPVYKSRSTANFRAHKPYPDGSGGLCRCHAEATFNRWEPQASVRAAQKVWNQVTKGRSGHDARLAFRQAIEGRKVTGESGGPSKGGRKPSTPRKQYEPATGLSGMTVERLQHQLQVTRALKPSEWRTKQIARLEAELSKRGVSKPLAQVG